MYVNWFYLLVWPWFADISVIRANLCHPTDITLPIFLPSRTERANTQCSANIMVGESFVKRPESNEGMGNVINGAAAALKEDIPEEHENKSQENTIPQWMRSSSHTETESHPPFINFPDRRIPTSSAGTSPTLPA